MQLTVVALGKVRQRFIAQGIDEYAKRIGNYASLRILEAKEQPYKEPLGSRQRDRVLQAEQERVEKLIPPHSFTIALDVGGRTMSSEEFSALLTELMISGRSQVTFLIGSSLGLAQNLLDSCQLRLSFGPMTFPHELARLMLLEQLYRAFTIMRKEPYHK
ncbi:MAG TPA: 23S rRNA (pseudouridine(1915)-N(3))-methyltransferase RlmH [Firmicutes bacterium]|nr:23S rRNA (pseudouridine(1915)-N(3))-methyltransferase RlmH [Bacillota bacterium]